MRFLIGAQLPRRLSSVFLLKGYEVLHTLDLDKGNQTTDQELNDISLQGKWIVVTKDADFVYSFLLYGKPHKLLPVSTGNISNGELVRMIEQNREGIKEAFSLGSYVELSRTSLVVRV